MAYTYTPTQQIEVARNRISTNDAVAETALSSMLAMAQGEQSTPQAVANPAVETETETPEKANFFQRMIETSLDWFKSVTVGLGKAFEGVVDFGAGAVGTVAGWFGNDDLKNSASDFVETDYVGGWMHELENNVEFFKFSNSFINDMSEKGQRIVRGVGEGVGQMLPLIAITALTGGVAAPAAGGAATASATAAGATAAQAAAAGAKAAKTISTIGKVVNMGLLGASAAGTGTEQALNYEIVDEDGSTRRPTLDRAFLYGLASGAVEMATETLVGGAYSKVFGGGVADKLINKLAKSTGFSKAVSFALNALGEGAEEVVSEAVSNTLQTIYNSEEGFHWEDPKVQDMFEAGVIGTLTSAVMSGGDAAVRKMSNTMSVQDHVAEARDIERKLENLSAQESLDQETASKLQASYQKNIDAIVKRYGRANDKTKAKIFKSTPGIGAYINEDGSRRTVELDEGAQAITSEESSSPALSQALLSRINEVANMLHAHGTTIAKDMTSDDIANTRKLRTALKKAGTDTGASIKVVVADNLAGANAFIDGDVMYISKKRVGDVSSVADDFAHESMHFAEGTEEHSKLTELFQKTIMSDDNKSVSLWDAAIHEVYKNTTANGRVDGYKISQETVDAFRKGSLEGLNAQQQKEWKLLYSEVSAKASELVFGESKYLNELVESDRSLTKAWLKKIKRTIDIVKATFSGDKESASALKWLQKAEHSFESALAASGEKYLRGKMGARKDDDDIDKNGETEYNKKKNNLINSTFPTYKEGQVTQANELATRWAHRADIEAGDQTAIPFNDNWYLIKKYDDSDWGYLIDAKLTEQEYLTYKEEWENGNGREQSIQEGISRFTSLDRQGDSSIRGKSNNDSSRSQQREKNQEVRGVGQEQSQRWETRSNGSGDSESGSTSKQGVNNISDTHYSLFDTDSQGNKLSEVQQKFFKDSKVRDKDGNLLVVYHGTKSEFTVFDRAKGGASNSIADVGFWFIADEQGALNWANSSWWGDSEKGKVIPVYLKINNPKIYESTNNNTDSLIERKRQLHRERAKIANKYLYDIDGVNGIKGVSEWDAFYCLVKKPQSADYFLDKISEEKRKKVLSAVDEYKKIESQEEAIGKQISELHYTSDGYQKFRADLYKIAGQTSEEANIAGAGYALKNAAETKAKFVESLKKQGYDGIVIHTDYDSNVFGENNTQYVVFDSNQIKLTSNKNPTANEDIRYNLGDTNIGKKPTFTGQQAKTIANNSAKKVYSRQDAEEVITAIVSEQFLMEDEGKYGELRGKGKEAVVDYLFRKFNSQDNKGKGAVALEIADYLIDTVTMVDMDVDFYDKSEDLNTINVLKQYMHKMDLRGIRDEIKYRYDHNNGVYLLWSAKKGEGMTPDVVAQELEHYGIYLKGNTESELFFEMIDRYKGAKDNIKESLKKQKLKDFGNAQDIKDLRQEIAREVLLAYDEKGVKSKYATEVLDKIEDLKAEIRKIKKEAYEYNSKVNAILDIAERLKPNSDKHRVNGSILEDATFNAVMKNLSKIKYRSDIRKHTARKVLASLTLWYNTTNPLLNGNVEDVDTVLKKEGSCGYLNSDILTILDDFVKNQDDRKPLSLDEVKDALLVMRHIDHLVKNYDHVLIGERSVRLKEAAKQTHQKASRYVEMHKKGKVSELLRKYGYNIIEPRTVLGDWFGYEDNPLMQAYDAITAGETKSGLVTLELITPIDEFIKDHRKYKTRLAKDKITVCGHEITVGAAISLYMLANQQASIEGLKKSGWGYYDNNGYWVNCGVMTDGDIKSLEEELSQADKDFIKVIRKVLDKSGEYMSETDILLKGFTTIVTENSDYFPIRRYQGDFARNVDQSFQEYMMNASVANLGVTKARIKNQRRIAVSDVMSILENHAKQVGLYTGLAVPIKEFQRIYNANIANTGSVPISVRNILNEKIWKDSGKYITNLLADIQGMNGRKSGIDRLVEKVRGSYAKFQLGANIKVIFSQAASYPTAFTDLSLEALSKAFTKLPKGDNMDKYCAWARVRNYSHSVVLAESVTDKIGAVGDAFTKPIQWMDRATIKLLWNACQFEIEHRHKGDASFKYGTEQNKIEAGKLLESVGRRTQPNYTATERSALQRSQSQIAKTFSMFSSVPLKQISRLYEAFGKERVLRYRKNKLGEKISDAELKSAHLYTAKAITAVTVANLVYVAMGEAIKYLLNKDRKDEEGNDIGLIEDFFRDFMSTTVGMLPFVKDIYNALINGFDNEDFVSSGFNSFIDATKEVYDGAVLIASGEPIEDKDIAAPIRSFAYALGQLTGIPTRNAYNLVYGLIKRFDPAKAYEMNSIFYSNALYTRDLKSAVEKGDDNKATTIIGLMLKDDGMTSTSPIVNEKLRTLYEAGFSVLPRTVKDTIAYDGEVIELSRSSQKAFKEIYGAANNEVESLVKSKAFTGLSDEVQAKAIKWIYDYYYEKAVTETIGAEANSKRQLFGETMAPSKFAMAFAACSAVESKVDRKGNTIAGSKRAAITKLLNKLSLTKAEKAIILAYLGYSVEDYETLIKSFISRIGLTRTQQKAFLKYANL